MDPVSLTAAVASLVINAAKSVATLKNLCDAYSEAESTIQSICTQTTVVSTSLTHLQMILLQNPDTIKEELLPVLDIAVTGCTVIFSCLEREVSTLPTAHAPGFLERIKLLWNQKQMDTFLQHFHGQQTALTMLLQLLQTQEMAEIKQLLREDDPVLWQFEKDTLGELLNFLSLLLSYSLVESVEDRRSYATHPAVHRWARHHCGQDHDNELARLAVVVMGWDVPHDSTRDYAVLQRRLLPHAQACSRWMEEKHSYYNESVLRRSRIEEREVVLDAIHGLGILYYNQGKLAEAEEMYIRALHGKEEALGPKHTSTLVC
ncbi:hypothetical protein GQ44DRAFT_779701 [Phaeosphaeriaceae sp. PMI808]|nr:hypothetical protein GQ44DRAFT_779701 [Phaeosphaeriaceae sp. PMI808]